MTITDSVSDLVAQALRTIGQPYPSDVTDRVCLAIENNPTWRARYDYLVAEGSPHVVNSAIGRATVRLAGLESLGVTRAARSSLIKTYTELGRSRRDE